MIFQVVIKVPPDTEGGNLAMPHVPLIEEVEPMSEKNNWKGKYKPVQFGGAILSLRQPVFALGEIVITSSGDREIVGGLRKASKWDVKVEEFDNIEDAVTRSQEITNGLN